MNEMADPSHIIGAFAVEDDRMFSQRYRFKQIVRDDNESRALLLHDLLDLGQ